MSTSSYRSPLFVSLASATLLALGALTAGTSSEAAFDAGSTELEFGQCPIVLGTVEPSMILSINPTQALVVDEVKVYVEARDDWTLVSALPGGQHIDYPISADSEHVLSIFDDGSNRKVEVRNRVGTGGSTQLRSRPTNNDRRNRPLGIHVLATSEDEHKIAVQYRGKSEVFTFRRPN